jgi:hypothetical protein
VDIIAFFGKKYKRKKERIIFNFHRTFADLFHSRILLTSLPLPVKRSKRLKKAQFNYQSF